MDALHSVVHAKSASHAVGPLVAMPERFPNAILHGPGYVFEA